MTRADTLFFDINETLLDLAPLKESIGAALGGRGELLPLWFVTLLQYSLVHTAIGDYRPFGEIGVDVLRMVAGRHGIELSRARAEEAVLEPLTRLPAHPDVVPALTALRASGLRIVALANNSAAGIAAQFRFAGLTDLFDRVISTEEVGAFKPDLRTYAHGLAVTGSRPEGVVMVAAHAWDLAGARTAGLGTAFVRRAGQDLYPGVDRPDHVVADLGQLTERLLGPGPDAPRRG